MRCVFTIELADVEGEAIAEVGPAGADEGHLHQDLIKGRHEVLEAVDAAAFA